MEPLQKLCSATSANVLSSSNPSVRGARRHALGDCACLRIASSSMERQFSRARAGVRSRQRATPRPESGPQPGVVSAATREALHLRQLARRRSSLWPKTTGP